MASPFSDFADQLFPSRKALVASASVLEAAQDRVLNLNTKLAVSNQVRAAWIQFQAADYGYLYAHQPAVRSVVDYIATNVVELGPKLYQRSGDIDRKEMGDHPAAVALREPNTWTPGRQFIFDVFADFLVYNNAYALKVKPPGQDRIFLLAVPASAVGVLGKGVYELAGYQIFRTDGSNFTVAPEEMIHWRGYSATDRRMGISKLETLRSELAEQAATQRANVDLMESGLQQRGYIKRPLEAPDWRKDGGKERFIEQFRAAMKRADRGYPVLEEGMEIAPLGVSPKDAEMLSSRQLFADDVAAQYGMVHCPPEGEEERRQFYADVLPPLCALFCDFLRLQFLQAEYMVDDMYFEFQVDKKQMSDNRLQALTSAAGVPPLLRNEARAMLNLPPVKGGDEPVTPANVLAGTKPSTGAMPPQDPNGNPQDGSFRLGPGPEKPLPPAKALEEGNLMDDVFMGADGELYVPLKRYVEEKKYNPKQPRDPGGEHGGQWIRKPGGLPHLPSAPSANDDPTWNAEGATWAEDPEWRAAQAGEGWQDAGEGWLGSPRSSPESQGVGVNESGAAGKEARRVHAQRLEKWAKQNREALAKRNPDMTVVDSHGAGYELKPKKGSKLSKLELKDRNPDYNPPGESLTHRVGDILKSPFLTDEDLSAREKDTFSWQHGQPLEELDRLAKLGGLAHPNTLFQRNRTYRLAVERGRKREEEGKTKPPPRKPSLPVVGPRGFPLGLSLADENVRWKRLEITTQPKVLADMARQKRNIDEATGTLQTFYNRQQRSLGKKALLGKAFDTERWNRELADDLVGLFASIIDREGGIYAARLGGDDFDLRAVGNYIKATAVKLAERINEATQRDVESGTATDALERAQDERAAIAGRGIGTKATLFARHEAAKQSPGYEYRTKTWVKDTDRHASLDGLTVRLDDDWGGIEPGSEPNCACTAVIL